jgi:hypothetical protein
MFIGVKAQSVGVGGSSFNLLKILKIKQMNVVCTLGIDIAL